MLCNNQTFRKPNIVANKSVLIEHSKTVRNLSKTIKQAEKVFHISDANKFY